MIVPLVSLNEIDRLNDSNLNLQAYEKAKPFGPLSEWEDTKAIQIASHLSFALGATKDAYWLTSRAWHRDKTDPESIFYWAAELLQKRGSLPALLFMRRFPDFVGDQKLKSWWYSLYGQSYAILRDFATAESWHQKAKAECPDEAWVWGSRAFALEQQDLYSEALENAEKALELAPHRRGTIASVAHYLTLLERDDDALKLLDRAVKEVENGWLLKQLGELQTELGMHREANETLLKCLEHFPLCDEATGKWLYGSLSDSAYVLGDLEMACEYAEKADNGFYKKVRENLLRKDRGSRRVQLDVGFLRQHHVTCAPATLSNVARFWNQTADHLELVEQMCYDGTPSYKERGWAEGNGWAVREFTLNWDESVALLNKGVPFTLATVHPGGGHLQAIIGYDEARRTFLVRDPFYRSTGEFLADEMIEQQQVNGPRVMALVPASSSELLQNGTNEYFESKLYDLVFSVESALDLHDRESALAALKELERSFPGHRLTIVARWSLARYDGNSVAVRSAAASLLDMYPDDVNLRLTELSISYDFQGRSERLETLESRARSEKTDPLIWQMFAYELSLDAKLHKRSMKWLYRTLRSIPTSGLTYRFMADVFWAQRKFDDAAELYRLGYTLNDTDEQLAYSYFSSMRFLRRQDEAVAVLRDRFNRFGSRSSQPVQSLFTALRELGLIETAFEALHEAIKLRPNDGELLLYAAEMMARFGRIAEAEAHLASGKPFSSEIKWLKAAAVIANLKGDIETAIKYWTRITEIDPIFFQAHENLALLKRGLYGTDAAKDHLKKATRKFPGNRPLQILRLQNLEDETSEAIAILRDLIRADRSDVWSHRELSSWYARIGKFDRSFESALAAVEIDPNDSFSQLFVGKSLELLKRYSEAAEYFVRAIELNVDNSHAISSLLGVRRRIEEKRYSIELIRSELKKQPGFGEGLFAYRREANLVVNRMTVLSELKEFREENPKVWFSASAVVQQLIDLGQFEEAEKLASENTKQFPLVHQVWADLANVHALTGNTDSEIESLKTAVSIDQVWTDGIQQLAGTLQRAGRLDEAKELLESALTRMPFDNFLLGYLADVHWNLGDKEMAIKTARKAISLDPEYSWAWNAIKRWAEQTGDHQLPVDMARELTGRKPKDARAWLVLAEMLDVGSYSQERMDAVNKVLELEPYSLSGLATQANLLADARRFEEAIEVTKTKLPDGHRPENLRYVEAGIEMQRGNQSRGLDILIELTESSPGYLPGWARLADIYRSYSNREHEYRKAALELVRLAPRDSTSYGYLAEACSRLGMVEEEKDALRQAVVLDPTYSYAVRRLFDLFIEANDFSAAEELVSSILVSAPYVGEPIAIELAANRNDKGKAIELLPQLFKFDEVDRYQAEQTMNAVFLHLAGNEAEIIETLIANLPNERVNPLVGRYVIEASSRSMKLAEITAVLEKLEGAPTCWSHAAARYMEILAEKKPRELKKFIDKNADKLRVETESWAAVGYHLTNVSDAHKVADWYGNWEARKDVMPWMLWNFVIVLHRQGWHDEADRISRRALDLRFDDSINIHLTTIGLLEFKAQHFEEAANFARSVNPLAIGGDWERVLYDVLDECLLAHEHFLAGNQDGGYALIESVSAKIMSVDRSGSDKLVQGLAAAARDTVLGLHGSKLSILGSKLRTWYNRLG